MVSGKVESWERCPDESFEAYEAFLIYRDLAYVDGEGGRSYLRVSQKCTKNESLIKRWGKTWDWQKRVADYDRRMDAMRQKIIESEYKRTVREMQSRHIKIALTLLANAIEKLNVLDGKNLTVNELIRFIESGVKMEREARGLPSSITEEHQGDAPERLTADDLGRLDGEVEEWYEQKYGSVSVE